MNYFVISFNLIFEVHLCKGYGGLVYLHFFITAVKIYDKGFIVFKFSFSILAVSDREIRNTYLEMLFFVLYMLTVLRHLCLFICVRVLSRTSKLT